MLYWGNSLLFWYLDPSWVALIFIEDIFPDVLRILHTVLHTYVTTWILLYDLSISKELWSSLQTHVGLLGTFDPGCEVRVAVYGWAGYHYLIVDVHGHLDRDFSLFFFSFCIIQRYLMMGFFCILNKRNTFVSPCVWRVATWYAGSPKIKGNVIVLYKYE